MDERMIVAISRLGLQQSASELSQELSRTFSNQTERMTVQHVQDTFSEVLNRAKAGEVQVIGDDAHEQAVIISMRDLALLLKTVAGSLSFGDALDMVGFKPVAGERLIYEQGRRGLPELRLYEGNPHYWVAARET
ncbi:MAG: hypothetical protein IRZ23_11755 [Acetobacteraceae bacterium]|nr:hypothetical protein [Acetobacteraceae bacterium]